MFMDYRTDYVSKGDLSAEEAKELEEVPTFLYAMPLGTAPNGRKRIFFEEVRNTISNRCARVPSVDTTSSDWIAHYCLRPCVRPIRHMWRIGQALDSVKDFPPVVGGFKRGFPMNSLSEVGLRRHTFEAFQRYLMSFVRGTEEKKAGLFRLRLTA